MKLHFPHIFKSSLCTLAIALAVTPAVQAHHDSNSLEIYPRDAADPCVEGSLQIRATVIGASHIGMIKLELFGEEDFLKKKGKLRRIRVPAEDNPVTICINVPEPGQYAVAGYHDKDGNRRLKKKWNYTPREPYALSNNPEIAELRKPKFEEAGFTVGVTGANIDLILVDLKARKKQKKAQKKSKD